MTEIILLSSLLFSLVLVTRQDEAVIEILSLFNMTNDKARTGSTTALLALVTESLVGQAVSEASV